MTKKQKQINLTESLEKLSGIVEWFDEQEDVDVEAGLEKVREAATLIKGSKTRLAKIENEFKEIEKEIGDDVSDVESNKELPQDDGGDGKNPEKMTF